MTILSSLGEKAPSATLSKGRLWIALALLWVVGEMAFIVAWLLLTGTASHAAGLLLYASISQGLLGSALSSIRLWVRRKEKTVSVLESTGIGLVTALPMTLFWIQYWGMDNLTVSAILFFVVSAISHSLWSRRIINGYVIGKEAGGA